MANSRFWWKFWQVYVQIVDSAFQIPFNKADPFLQSSIKILWLKCFDRLSFDFSTKYYILYFVFHVTVLWCYPNAPCQYHQNETIHHHSDGIFHLTLILILQSYCSAGSSEISAFSLTWNENKWWISKTSLREAAFFWRRREQAKSKLILHTAVTLIAMILSVNVTSWNKFVMLVHS